MALKGDLKLEIDELGIEVRITITPDENGADISPESLMAVLTEKKVRSGIDSGAIEYAFRTLARKKTEPVTFVAAAGVPPQPGAPESVVFEPLPVPERLAALADRVLKTAAPPRGFRLREERIKTEKRVLKKAALPFLPPREQIEVVVEKRTVREDVTIDPHLEGTGYVTRGSMVARIRPGTQGKEGRSVFGRLVQAPRPTQGGFLCLKGVSRTGGDANADVTGFLRRGENWCDVVPFRDHSLTVVRSKDGMSCLLSFVPGDEIAPAPDTKEVLSRAAALGFGAASLLPAHEIESMMQDCILRGAPLEGASLTPTVNGVAVVTVSADKLKAFLFLRKGRGGGTPLAPSAVSEAIRASRVKGFNPDIARKDLLAFFAGSAAELTDYILVSGRAAKPGAEPKIEWRAMFLPSEEAAVIRAAAASRPESLASLASLGAFPLSRVDAVARVEKDTEVLRIAPSLGGEPGVDVFGAVVSPSRNGAADLRLFEGVAMRKDVVVATAPGILEKGSEGAAILLRVRPHREATLQVTLSPDRMSAAVSFFPPEGAGARISADEVRVRLRQAGVQKGIDEQKLLVLMDKVLRGEGFVDQLVAQGRPPRQERQKRVAFHVRLAASTRRPLPGTTRISKGELVATVLPRDPLAENGWDVCGKVLVLPPEAQETLKAGRGIREEIQPDGSLRFISDAAGELVRDGILLSVSEAYTVEGDVSAAKGNIKFPGLVRISGSVRAGLSVVAGGVLEVGGTVEAALLSAEGSITVAQGIKGAGKAILRSKRDIEGMFAEESVLLSIGDVHLHGPCIRCQVKCNGRLLLDGEKGSLVAGEVRASRGVAAQNIGSPSGARTVVSFGQDFLVKDQIEREEREVVALTKRVAALDAEMFVAEKRAAEAGPAAGPGPAQPPAAALLARARAQKVQAMKLIEAHKMRLITLRDRYDEHVPSEVIVRGTLYPGVILESHGRRYEARAEKKSISLHFDPVQGRIVEKV
ncbi:MAG: FapA family protein [Spirochaetia bacterium]